MTDHVEYRSNPKLASLADELSALNEMLIQLGLPDNARLLRLRLYAESRMAHPELKLPKWNKHLEVGEAEKVTRKRRPPSTAGVYEIGGRFRAAITVNGKSKYLGTFDDEREAHEAFKRAHVEHWGERSVYYKDMMRQEETADA